ncbi:uncharacterized protein OCT59_002405 [Rhizophagus irregularis]|uniref:uncharacterized protein n=1 Tax=Rhizophagus irregularis TaxID=588596 RepID=UPI00332D361F|nr:hypothetical protein OCT59_002405 [Rhizophagus irregularis]
MSDNITNTYAMGLDKNVYRKINNTTRRGTIERCGYTIELFRRGTDLSEQERNSLEKLRVLLHDREMSTDDIKLLCELKNYSNTLFHKNNQTIEQAKAQLNDLLPERMRIYEFLLQKALKAISFWRK